jgi:hypothetical protein
LGNNLLEFFIPHEWFTADEGYMDRSVTVDELHYAVDEFLPAKVAHLPKYGFTPKVVLAVRVAARTTERTLFRDFDGKKWSVAR